MSYAYTNYCTCGATLDVRGAGTMPQPVLQAWLELHSGHGHEETDALTAARARWRRENPTVREEEPATAG